MCRSNRLNAQAIVTVTVPIRRIVAFRMHEQIKYSETSVYDHLRNRDNLGIKDSYFSP